MLVQSINNNSNYQLNFESKLNVIGKRSYTFDTELIDTFVSSDGGVLLNLKKMIFHSKPNERQMQEFNYACQNIVEKYSVTHMPTKYNAGGHPERWYEYDHISEHAVVSTPEYAESMLKLYKENFWNEFGVKQLKINMSYDAFLKIYREAIKPENASVVYDV